MVELELYAVGILNQKLIEQVYGNADVLADVLNRISDVIGGFYNWHNWEK